MDEIKEEKKYAKFVMWCLDEFWRIQKFLNLENYRVKMERLPNLNYENAYLEITLSHPYQESRLKFALKAFEDWQEKQYKDVSQALIHEALHLLVHPLSTAGSTRYIAHEQIKYFTEELVDKLTILMRYDILKKWEKKK